MKSVKVEQWMYHGKKCMVGMTCRKGRFIFCSRNEKK